MICSSVSRLCFIAGPSPGIIAEPTLIQGGPVFGEQVESTRAESADEAQTK